MESDLPYAIRDLERFLKKLKVPQFAQSNIKTTFRALRSHIPGSAIMSKILTVFGATGVEGGSVA
jgi:hypothetical protein